MNDQPTLALDPQDATAMQWQLTPQLRLTQCRPAIRTLEGELTLESREEGPDHLIFRFANGLAMQWTATPDAATRTIRVAARLENRGEQPVALERVDLLRVGAIESAPTLDRVMHQGRDMTGMSGVRPITEAVISDACLGLSTAEGAAALLLGFERLDDAFYQVGLDTPESPALWAGAVREGIALKPGDTLEPAPLCVAWGESLSAMLEAYADAVGNNMNARLVAPNQNGWCSWYYYYGTETEHDVMDNVRALAGSSISPHLKIIQMDDGWNIPEPGHPRCWGDWTAGYKFADGMRATVEKIREYGFEAGLWLAPFSVDEGSKLFKEHPEWLVQAQVKDSTLIEPAGFWGVYGLDLTQDAVLEFLHGVFDRVFNEWGFTYIKIDFLLHALQPGRRQRDDMTTVEAFRRGMQVIRDVAGDRFILNCGSPLGAAVGLCDAMRIGMDISSRWYVPMGLENWPLGNCNIKSGAYQVLGRQWMHRRWWRNDPDCLLLRNHASPGELHEFKKLEDGRFFEDPPYGLTEAQAGLWARLLWMTGGLAMLGEHLDDLEPERYALLEQCFPLCEDGATRLDLYEHPEVVAMGDSHKPRRVGLFNLSDEARRISFARERLDWPNPWACTERFSDETCEGAGDRIDFPELPPHSARIWELKP